MFYIMNKQNKQFVKLLIYTGVELTTNKDEALKCKDVVTARALRDEFAPDCAVVTEVTKYEIVA